MRLIMQLCLMPLAFFVLASCAYGPANKTDNLSTAGSTLTEADFQEFAVQVTNDHHWEVTVASWNLLNFSLNKATYGGAGDRVNLLTRMGAIAGGYDIIVFQEVLQTGASVTNHLINYLPFGYTCLNVSAPSGRVGRQERYVVCSHAANAFGTIAVTGWTDYSTTGANYVAADGSARPAANVWMRPPIIATITYTPTDPFFQPVVFDIYTNHTKPAYGYSANARPPGTVAGAPNSSSVHYELRAIEQNQAGGVNKMLIGDLNSDCASYPVRDRGLDFAAGWTWYVNYGQRTNTAVGTACGYDRIIINNALNAYYEGHGINYDHYGNATRVNGKRISDHYLVWVKFGETRAPKRPRLTASVSAAVSQGNKQRKYKKTDTVYTKGTQLKASVASGQFFIVPYSTAQNFKSHFTYTLSDIRGAPSAVSTDANGDFTQTVSWANPPEGAYVFVFDANGDGKFSLKDGDFANYNTQADILVTSDSSGHNDLVTLGDNMVLRDVFDLDQAYNIYALAKNLPASHSSYAYIISDFLLVKAGYNSWAEARAAQIDLATYAIPIQLSNSKMIVTSQLTDDDKRQAFTTNPDGETFFSLWPHPGQLISASVNYQPPPSSVFKPSYAGTGDPPKSPDDTSYDDDPCDTASSSADEDFQKTCNLGFLFANYYGNSFNVVFDIDGNGKLGANDPVDTRDIGDMTNYFNRTGTTVLGPNANGDPAVSEFKEYLERALSVSLSQGNVYDQATEAAALRYACSAQLTKTNFQTLITPDAQTGFRVLDDDAYHSERTHGSGIYQYGSAFLDDWSGNNVTQCITGGDMTYGGTMTAENDSKIGSIANSHSFENVQVSANVSTACWVSVAAEGVAGAAFTVGAGTGFFTFGASTLVGVVVAVGAVAVANLTACT